MSKNRGYNQGQNRESTSNHICNSKEPAKQYPNLKFQKKKTKNRAKPKNWILVYLKAEE